MHGHKDPGSTDELPRIELCSKADLDNWMQSLEGERLLGYLLRITQNRSGKQDEDIALILLGRLYEEACNKIEQGKLIVGSELSLRYYFYPLAAYRVCNYYARERKHINNLGEFAGHVVDGNTEQDEKMRQIRDVVKKLPRKQQLAADLYIDLTVSPLERVGSMKTISQLAARILAEKHRIEMTPEAVEKNWQRAKIKIKTILGQDFWS